MDPLARLAALEGVASGMASTRDGIDAMLRDRGLRRTAPEMTGQSLLIGAHASAVLEGSTSVFERMEAGEYDEVAAAAIRVSTELLGLAPTLGTSPLQVLARLHTLAAKGVVADEDLGRPVQGAARLSDLSHLLLEDTTAPALVAAAVAHAELISVAPFVSHNGIVARAFERLIMVARGVDPTSLVVPEAGHLASRREYESNLRAYRDGGTAGVHAWLLYAASAYAAGANASPLKNP
ncbi:MAG TPA: oxidoreductase [Nocardioidaceae bacterium]|nr:oxidoreductase [Nocardioidaceae bacterium]